MGKNGQFDTMGKSWKLGAEKLGIAHFDIRYCNFVEIMYPFTSGPARAHGQSTFLGRQVMFGLEKLGSVHFDAWKCYVLFILIKENIPGAKFWRCQIVRGVKLSVFTHGVKLSAVSNCPGVKLSGVKLSAVSNCPPTLPVSNCPRCQIVLVSNCPRIPWIIFLKVFLDTSFSHHLQRSIDFNTVNIQRTKGMYFLVLTGNRADIGGYDLQRSYYPIQSLCPRECTKKYVSRDCISSYTP